MSFFINYYVKNFNVPACYFQIIGDCEEIDDEMTFKRSKVKRV